METAAIAYRVADFLKTHAPFNAVDDADLLALAGGGRVRFHEPNEYILWQGEPHRHHVFVIQQGTVSLWDESAEEAKLRDVRGAGDMLGIERYNDVRSTPFSARSETDVVIYAFAASDFEAFVLQYPLALAYVSAEARVTPDYHPAGDRRDAARVFLHELGRQPFPSCAAGVSIADAALHLLQARSDVLVVLDDEHRPRQVLTADAFLRWVADGGDGSQRIEMLAGTGPATLGPDATAADGLLTMGTAAVDAVAITSDGTPSGRVQSVVTRGELASLFGHNPVALLHDIRMAATTRELCELNTRVRAFVLAQLTGASAAEWLVRFTHLVDIAIVTRATAIAGADAVPAAWCFAGSSGRGESPTMLAPLLLGIFDDEVAPAVVRAQWRTVLDAVLECGYLPRQGLPFETDFYGAPAREWRSRYVHWIKDPVRQQTYRARTLFDVRAIGGQRARWDSIAETIAAGVDRDFVHVLANDCLATLPPLTFFQDAVVDSFGEHTTTFRLEHSAMRPLVDVGRVFAFAAGDLRARSTLDRFTIARALLPEQEATFREAADTVRVVLWQQGRVGIAQGTSGAELPAAALSRHDRQVLKRGFRSILDLLEFTANPTWLDRL